MKLLFSLLALAMLNYGCQKELSDFKTGEDDIVSLGQFFTKNAAPLQRFTASASNPIRVTAAKGTGVNFPDNAFVTLNNASVTGTVTIEVKEILTPADMILNNTPTMSNGLPLESGGEFFVRVTQNNEVLRLAPGKYIQLNLTNPTGVNMAGMQVFNGDDSSANTVNWIPNTTPGNVVQDDSISTVSLFADNLQWINCDKFINDPKIKYTVAPGNSPNIDSTVVYVHFTERNAIMSVGRTDNRFVSESVIATAATIIGICIVDKTIYYAMMPVTLQDGGSTTLNFTPITEEDLKKKLSALN
jgi:hypothetical protein